MRWLVLLLVLLPTLARAEGPWPATPTTQATPTLQEGGEVWTFEYGDGYGRIHKWGTGPDYVRMTKIGRRHYRLAHNLDSWHSRLPEDGSLNAVPLQDTTADVQYLDMDAGHTVGEISLYEGHCDSSSGLTPETSSCAQNRVGVNVVRVFFGPDDAPDVAPHSCGGVGGDCGRRIGPSARGDAPALQSQLYEVLIMWDQDVSAGTSGNRTVCLSTAAYMRAHVCTPADALSSYLGIANISGTEGIGGIAYVSRFGIATGIDCTGTINRGDRVRVATGFTGLVAADNDGSATVTVGIAMSTCGEDEGGKVSVLLGSKGASTTKLTLRAGSCFGGKAIYPSTTPTPTATKTPTPGTPTAVTPTPTPTATMQPLLSPEWDAISSDNIPAPRCIAEFNTAKLVLDFPDAQMTCISRAIAAPSDWLLTTTAKIFWLSTVTSGNVRWSLTFMCAADGAGDDQAFNIATAATDPTKATALTMNTVSITPATASLLGCTAGSMLHVKVCRDGASGADTMLGTATFYALELLLTR